MAGLATMGANEVGRVKGGPVRASVLRCFLSNRLSDRSRRRLLSNRRLPSLIAVRQRDLSAAADSHKSISISRSVSDCSSASLGTSSLTILASFAESSVQRRAVVFGSWVSDMRAMWPVHLN